MSIFSQQEVHCQICGTSFSTDFQSYKGRVCGPECWRELEWRKTLSILGKDYYPPPILAPTQPSGS